MCVAQPAMLQLSTTGGDGDDDDDSDADEEV